MARSGKRLRTIREKVEPAKIYEPDEALELLTSTSKLKFVESVDVAIRLGVDPKKSDQAVRGSSVLPNGTGKVVRVAVFTQGRIAVTGNSYQFNPLLLDQIYQSGNFIRFAAVT